MSILSVLGSIVKGKVIVTTLVGVALVGGAGAALAATPTGHDLVQTITGVHATATPTHESDKDATHGTATPGAQDQKDAHSACAGEPEAKNLATQFSLSTDAKGTALQTICALHDGTFKGTADGKNVTIDHALGYGEINQLLTDAQSMATKKGDKLTDSNIAQYVATILNSCGTTPLMACINTHGKPTGTPTADDHGNKPTGTPTAEDHGNKPTSTPTPHDGKPTGTPTPTAK